MADFPYSPQPTSLKRFLEHVQSAGVPDRVSQKYLEKVGFKAKNDRYIIGVLKFLGLLDPSGNPTKTWQAYRSRSSAAATLGEAIKRSYVDLFRTYPDAQRKDNEALRNYFSAHTRVAESTLALIVSTFKALCALAEFDGESAAATEKSSQEHEPTEAALKSGQLTPLPVSLPRPILAPAININIQLELPVTESAEIYDKLFAAMKKHLFS